MPVGIDEVYTRKVGATGAETEWLSSDEGQWTMHGELTRREGEIVEGSVWIYGRGTLIGMLRNVRAIRVSRPAGWLAARRRHQRRPTGGGAANEPTASDARRSSDGSRHPTFQAYERVAISAGSTRPSTSVARKKSHHNGGIGSKPPDTQPPLQSLAATTSGGHAHQKSPLAATANSTNGDDIRRGSSSSAAVKLANAMSAIKRTHFHESARVALLALTPKIRSIVGAAIVTSLRSSKRRLRPEGKSDRGANTRNNKKTAGKLKTRIFDRQPAKIYKTTRTQMRRSIVSTTHNRQRRLSLQER